MEAELSGKIQILSGGDIKVDYIRTGGVDAATGKVWLATASDGEISEGTPDADVDIEAYEVELQDGQGKATTLKVRRGSGEVGDSWKTKTPDNWRPFHNEILGTVSGEGNEYVVAGDHALMHDDFVGEDGEVKVRVYGDLSVLTDLCEPGKK